MEIKLAKYAGFCYGVERAYSLALKSAEKYGGCYTLGALIHNKRAVKKLEERGVIKAESIEEIPPGAVVLLRSHGAAEEEAKALLERECRVIDATCPNVSKIHKIVREASKRGRAVIIIGDFAHPEIKAICGWAKRSYVYKNGKELAERMQTELPDKNIAVSVVSQTTETRNNVKNCAEIIKKEYTNCEIFDTICEATSRRQEEAGKLADICGAIVVIGDKLSANSKKLAEICSENCSKVCFIESADELDLEKLGDADILAITAGASTPAWIIEEVHNKMTDELKELETNEQAQNEQQNEVPGEAAVLSDTVTAADAQLEAVSQPEAARTETVPAAETAPVTEFAPETEALSEPAKPAADENADESFDEMLEKNLKTLNTGEKVKGIVESISATEVSVDLGTKHSGYIPMSELTDDPDLKPEDIVQIGAEVEAYVLRVNDVEGTIMLSKKRLDTVKNWEIIEKAKDDKTILEGTVIEENKGGIIVLVKGIRVFVPASQSGLSKGAEMSQLMKTKQKLRITEVNHSRRRVVGSIRAVSFELRKINSEKTWEEIEVGKVYSGLVKSLTSYGAFVDIGGVDGMVHVSELSWQRIKHPSEVVNAGDTIEVFVISFDKENKKISLGYKKSEDNPWTLFCARYKIGSVLPVKIVKLMQFGAFAEILPGVDGLIHVSQITGERRIEKPGEVLSEGQEVTVKITNIDEDKKKVSLSIRALEDEPMPEYETLGDDEPEDDIEHETEE